MLLLGLLVVEELLVMLVLMAIGESWTPSHTRMSGCAAPLFMGPLALCIHCAELPTGCFLEQEASSAPCFDHSTGFAVVPDVSLVYAGAVHVFSSHL